MMKPKILLIDNYDSFTYNLYDYFLQLNTQCEVIRNDALTFEEFTKKEFDGLVLSPGPKAPNDAGQLLNLIKYFHPHKPILGICLGHQGIGEFFGAKLVKAFSPMHGKTSRIYHKGHSIFKELPSSFEVMRYHSLILEDLESLPLYNIAQTEDGEVMGLAHKDLPIYGVQFHPESILTEHGLAMLNNWLDIVKSDGLVIRKMQTDEAERTCQLIQEIWETNMVPITSEEGTHFFSMEYFVPQNMLKRRRKGHKVFLAFSKGVLVGMSEIRSPGHIVLCFVHPDFQNQKIGMHVLNHAVSMCRKIYKKSEKVTLNSSIKAVDFYERNGFKKTGNPESKNGMVSQPMEIG